MAIKINVSKSDQNTINQILDSCGYAPQKRKFHCTIGFIEKTIPEDEANRFGHEITQRLQDVIDPLNPTYEVEKVNHLFGHVIAFEPTAKSRLVLQSINEWLFEKVNEVSDYKWSFNETTQPTGFTPHMTLWRTRKTDERFKKLTLQAELHPVYQLSQAGYVLF